MKDMRMYQIHRICERWFIHELDDGEAIAHIKKILQEP